MPRISADSVEEHSEQVHRRVFAALAELLADHDLDAVSMAQLAAAAGLGRTAIYHHFHDRDAVVVAFAADEAARYLEALQAGLGGAPDPVERLRVYVRHHLDAGGRTPLGLATRVEGSLSPESALALRGHVAAVEQVLGDLLTDGAGTGDLVVDDVPATVSLVHATLVAPELPPETVERFVLRALGVDAGRGTPPAD